MSMMSGCREITATMGVIHLPSHSHELDGAFTVAFCVFTYRPVSDLPTKTCNVVGLGVAGVGYTYRWEAVAVPDMMRVVVDTEADDPVGFGRLLDLFQKN